MVIVLIFFVVCNVQTYMVLSIIYYVILLPDTFDIILHVAIYIIFNSRFALGKLRKK